MYSPFIHVIVITAIYSNSPLFVRSILLIGSYILTNDKRLTSTLMVYTMWIMLNAFILTSMSFNSLYWQVLIIGIFSHLIHPTIGKIILSHSNLYLLQSYA